jgi:CheY-like chemotaxis protein
MGNEPGTPGTLSEGLLEELPGAVYRCRANADWTMLYMSGVEAVERIRELRADFVVLFISGYPGDHLKADFGGKVEAPFLAKPFTRRVLGQKLREVLDARD